MNTQQQIEYKKQISEFIEFEGLIAKYRYRHKNAVTYILLVYRQRFFTLEISPLAIDELKNELKALINDETICNTIDRINRFPSRNFFVAASLTMFSQLSQQK